MDKILIRDLLVRGIIGINEWEREKKQDILINITLFANLEKSVKSDNIEDTINYRTLTKQILDLIDNSKFYLVEKLAEEIAKISIIEFKAEKVIVRVEKPGALRFASSVGVEIERESSSYT